MSDYFPIFAAIINLCRMKKLRILCMFVFAMAMSTAVAQEIDEVVDSVKSGLKADNVKEAVSKVQDSFKTKKAEADSLISKWVYDGPAVYATKGNKLIRLVENTTVKQLEKLLDDYMEKSRITKENTSFTFHENGTFDRDVVGHKAHGVWLMNGERLILGINHVMTADITAHQDDGSLMFLIDVDKLMNIMKLMGAMKDNKTNNALIKLSKKIPGLQAGIKLVKKP